MSHLRPLRALLALVTLLALAMGALPAAAQPQDQAVVVFTDGKDLGDRLGLSIYFQLRRADGTPILKDDVKLASEGTLRLFQGSEETVQVAISEPDIPLKILLLIDTSSSMRPVIGEVREAAKKAIREAPERALLAVYTFDTTQVGQNPSLFIDFTADKERVAAAIDQIPQPPPSGNLTCLYNAAYQSIELLTPRENDPLERRALLLFTDGRDDDGTGQPCSTRKVEDVLAAALERRIPIYTLGLCLDASCSLLDPEVLERIARDTGGFWSVGPREQLERRFTEIIDGLSSQWRAYAEIYPAQDRNEATLTIPQERGQPLIGTFSFISPKNFFPTPRIELAPAPAPDRNAYDLEVKIDNPAAVRELQVELWDLKTGRLGEPQIVATEMLTRPLEFSTTAWTAGREYEFRVRPISRGGTEFRDKDGQPLVVKQVITFEPLLRVTVEGFETDWPRNKLYFKLNSQGLGGQPLVFDVNIVAQQGNTIFDQSGLAPSSDGRLELELPPELRRASPGEQFRLTLTPGDGGTAVEVPPFEFSLTPPAGIDWLVVIGVAAALLAAGGLLWALRRQRALRPSRIPQPLPQYSEPTGRFAPPEPAPQDRRAPPRAGPRLRLRVLRTPDESQRRDHMLSSFPCTIGRGDKATLQIKNDGDLSRLHAEIRSAGSGFSITDLESANGTFLNERRLAANLPAALEGRVRVRLGPNTELEVEPLP